MKMTKRVLGILLACMMLMSMLSIGVFAAEGDQNDPINANDKWFGYGVDCFLMNTTLEAGDSDGVWYELIADAAGIMQLEHSYNNVDYQITVNVNGQEYLGYENGVYNMPIATLPVAVGDVISIHLIAQDTSMSGLVYMNAKFITGANDPNQTVKLKGANVKVWVAGGATVYFQDDSLNAEYAAKGLKLSSSATEGITVISNSKNYTDTDGDGLVELVLGGSAGGAGAPPVKPSFAITNNSGADAWFVLNVAETAHECVYDGDTDVDCNSCGEIRDLACKHSYSYNCDKVCALCGEETRPEADHDYDIGCATNCIWCGQLTNPDAVCISDAEYPCQDGNCIYCLTAMPATAAHTYDNDCDVDCNVCGETREAGHEYMFPCDATCMNCGELTNPDAAHSLQHVDAVEATCQAIGNVEYWTCEHCGYAWLDEACTIVANRMNIIVPMTSHEYMYACDGWCMNCYEFTNPDAAHSLSYVEAVAATCDTPGNIAYWTCEHCGGCWDNENAMGMPLNRFMIVIPAAHTYDNDFDDVCNACGDIRLVEYELISFLGNSVSEDVSGLAFLFDLKADGVAIYSTTKSTVDLHNATVTPNSQSGALKLVGMGAVVSNNWGITYLDYVDDKNVVNIPVKYLCDDDVTDSATFAVRIVDIPESDYETQITARPYYIYENAEGNQIVVYGAEESSSYNDVLYNG